MIETVLSVKHGLSVKHWNNFNLFTMNIVQLTMILKVASSPHQKEIFGSNFKPGEEVLSNE